MARGQPRNLYTRRFYLHALSPSPISCAGAALASCPGFPVAASFASSGHLPNLLHAYAACVSSFSFAISPQANNLLLRSAILLRITWQYSGDCSIKILFLPHLFAATAVVPEPAQLSKTVSLSFV